MNAELDRFDLVRPLIDAALAEDVGSGDATTLATVPAPARGEAVILAKEEGVVCGLGVARAVFERVDPAAAFEADAADGDAVLPGQVVARVTGPARGLLTAERTALNFLQHLSGIATATRRAATALEGTGARVLDTRKTVPGMRLLAKYAVRCGGGENHRQGLYDMILIKENHIAAAGGIPAAVRRAREARSDLKIEVEVTDLAELDQALTSGVDRVMLDNFTPERVRDALERIRSWSERAGRARPEVEISGRITPETARSFALPGVDFMSSGALTHSVRALDGAPAPSVRRTLIRGEHRMQLTAANLQLAFRNSASVRHFFFYPSIGSTNDKARELALAGAEEGTLVIADAQTAGKGRLGRSWHSPAGLGLYVSFIFRPGVPATSASGILMAVGLGAAEAVERSRIQGVVGIKWPNDLVVEGRKLGGILLEMGVQGGVLEWCVAGIGLNVGHTEADFPVELRDRAISMRQCCHRHVDRLGVLLALIERVSHWNELFRNEGTGPLIPLWRRRSAILNRTVRVETAGGVVVGTAVGIEPDGALRVRLESGTEEILHAGDVHLVQYR